MCRHWIHSVLPRTQYHQPCRSMVLVDWTTEETSQLMVTATSPPSLEIQARGDTSPPELAPLRCPESPSRFDSHCHRSNIASCRAVHVEILQSASGRGSSCAVSPSAMRSISLKLSRICSHTLNNVASQCRCESNAGSPREPPSLPPIVLT